MHRRVRAAASPCFFAAQAIESLHTLLVFSRVGRESPYPLRTGLRYSDAAVEILSFSSVFLVDRSALVALLADRAGGKKWAHDRHDCF